MESAVTSLHLFRLFLALLTSAYREDTVSGEKRAYLALHPAMAPVKVSVLPLVRNKPELMDKARQIFRTLQKSGLNCQFDAAGAIGRRYRRADEIGTPFCVTVDFESLAENTVTLRCRDSTLQSRMHAGDLLAHIRGSLENNFESCSLS